MKRTKIDKTNFHKQRIEISEGFLKKAKEEKWIKNYYKDGDFILINGECIETMNKMIEKCIFVNHIITDIPYGSVNGLSIDGWKKANKIPEWDILIDEQKMLSNCFYLTKSNSNVLLFSQEPLTSKLIWNINLFKKYSLSNKMIWAKNNHANGFNSKTTPLNYYEEILLIRKSLDETNNIILRSYFKSVLDFIPKTKKEIMNRLGQGLDHCFRFENRTFYPASRANYQKLIDEYGIDKMNGFLNYEQIQRQWKEENDVIFNIPIGQKIVRNVLDYKKDTNNIHPTQKPIELLSFLIKTFSNEKETILDFTSGSGSTGIAAIKNGRKFIGIELNDDFFNKSINWYENEFKKSGNT